MDSAKEYEEGIFGSSKKVSPKSSLEGVLAPHPRRQQPPGVSNRRVQELLERRKNWMFSSPSDMNAGPTAAEILNFTEYGLDGREKKNGPSPEKYYEDEENEGKSDRTRDGRRSGEDRFSEREESLRRLPERIEEILGSRKDSEGKNRDHDSFASEEDDFGKRKNLSDPEKPSKGFFDSDSVKGGFFGSEKKESFADSFWSTGDPASADFSQAQKARRQAFEKLLPAPVAATPVFDGGAANPLGGAGDAKLPTVSALPSLDSPFGSPAARGGMDSRFLGTLTPMAGGLSDANSRLSGFTAPAMLPKFEPPKLVTPPPSFTAPRRAF
jgi:hypothetical protein